MKFHHNLRNIPYLHYWYLPAQKGNFTTTYGTFNIFTTGIYQLRKEISPQPTEHSISSLITTGIYQLRKEISPQPTEHSISSLLVFTSSERKFHHNLRNIPYLHYWYLPAQKRNFTTTYGTFHIFTTGIYQLRKEISPQPTEHSISSLLVFTSSERKFRHNLRNIPYLHYWYLPAQKGNFTTTYGTFHIFTTGIYQPRKEISPQPTERIPYLHYWYLPAQKGNFTTTYGTFHIFTTGIYQLRKEISPQPTEHSISTLLVFTSPERKFHHNLRNIPYLHYWYLPAQKGNFTTTYGTFHIFTTGIYQPRKEISPQPRNIPYLHYWYLPAQKGNFTTTYGTFDIFTTGIYQPRKEISPQPTEHSISSLLVFTSSEMKFHHNLRNIPYLHYWYLPAQKGNFTTTYGTFHIFTTGIYQLRKEISPQPTEHSISSLLVFTSSERKFHYNLRNIPYLHYWYLPAQKGNFTTTYGTFHIFTSLLVFTSPERKFHHNLRNIPYLHYWYLPAQK